MESMDSFPVQERHSLSYSTNAFVAGLEREQGKV